jgi:hypothetical protein
MGNKDHGFKHGFLRVLNRCGAASFFPTARAAGQEGKTHLLCEIHPRTPRNLARERYLAIPTFIRQGKTLGL